MSSLTWLVTGASSGLGAELALAVLKAGHKVIGTARNIEKAQESYPQIAQLGGSWITLDVTDPETQTIVARVVEANHVDVVVNNAGYGLRGPLEDLTMSQITAQMDTNFFGAVAVMKGCIPYFRQRGSGTIVNISSTSGITAKAGYSLYSASKFALEGASESLAAELAPFGIRVLVVEPGAFRTQFLNALVRGQDVHDGEVSTPYQGTIAEKVAIEMSSANGRQAGDPKKAGEAIVGVVTGTGVGKDLTDVLRLPLGNDALERANQKIERFTADVEKSRSIATWAVFDN